MRLYYGARNKKAVPLQVGEFPICDVYSSMQIPAFTREAFISSFITTRNLCNSLPDDQEELNEWQQSGVDVTNVLTEPVQVNDRSTIVLSCYWFAATYILLLTLIFAVPILERRLRWDNKKSKFYNSRASWAEGNATGAHICSFRILYFA